MRFWRKRTPSNMYRVRYSEGGFAYFPATKYLAIEHAKEHGGVVEEIQGPWLPLAPEERPSE